MPANPAMPTTIPTFGDVLDTRCASSQVPQMLPPGKPSTSAMQMWKAAGLVPADPRRASQIPQEAMLQSDTEFVMTMAAPGLTGLEYRLSTTAAKNLTIQQLRENYRDSSHQRSPVPRSTTANLSDVVVTEAPAAMPSLGRHDDDVLKGFPAGLPAGQAALPMPTPCVAPAADSGRSSASVVNESELHALLENFCQSLYRENQSGSHSFGCVVLNVGAILPGAMIEMSRQGASLQVRLYASNQETLLVMQREREKLNASLTASTNLLVKVEAIARG